MMYSKILVDIYQHADASGGLGACPPRKFLKNGCSEIKSEVISKSSYVRYGILCILHIAIIAGKIIPLSR